MDFLKKHYEKVLLGAVLLGLAVAVGFLFFKIASEKAELARKEAELRSPKVNPLPPLNLSPYAAVLQRLGTPAILDLSAPHKLFNPMPWQKTPDGRLIRVDANSIGPRAVVVTKINELHLELALDNVSVEDSAPKFVIGVKREAAPNPKDRRKTERYCKVGDKNDVFMLKQFRGPPDNPTNVVVVLNDTHEEAVITNGSNKLKPGFQRIDGYTADLKYPPENKTWLNRRANMPPPLAFNAEEYDIVSISNIEVVLRAKSNQKKWSIAYHSPD
ncbi:MAG: hypothetical protein ABSF95_16015 [Verrucomicrobiota bacterium]|jgi:hypothetical protein